MWGSSSLRNHLWFRCFALAPSVKHTFLLSDLASLICLFSLVLKQAVYCVCSAEQPALKAVCVCLSQPACQTVLIPTEAWLTSSRLAPTPFSPSPLPRASVWSGCPLRQLIGSLNASQILLAPPLPMTSQDQTAIRDQRLWVFLPHRLLTTPMVLCCRSMSKVVAQKEGKRGGTPRVMTGCITHCSPHVGTLVSGQREGGRGLQPTYWIGLVRLTQKGIKIAWMWSWIFGLIWIFCNVGFCWCFKKWPVIFNVSNRFILFQWVSALVWELVPA